MPKEKEAALDRDIERLYRGPLEAFTAARNDLAAELRDSGDADAAEAVKALKKPTRAAWLVNQLAERKPKQLEELTEIGDELRDRQQQLLDGKGDPAALRKAAQREQRTIDELADAARRLGAEHGAGAQILDRVVETLQAASTDPELAETVGRGVLTREQRRSSVGMGGMTAPKAPRKPSAKQRKAAKEAERAVATAEKAVERARAQRDKARTALQAREQALRDAEDELADAQKRLSSP